MECGLSQEEIDRVPAGLTAPECSWEKRTVLRAVYELHFTAHIHDEVWAELAGQFSERQLIEFLVLAENDPTLAYVMNNVGIRPPGGEVRSRTGR